MDTKILNKIASKMINIGLQYSITCWIVLDTEDELEDYYSDRYCTNYIYDDGTVIVRTYMEEDNYGDDCDGDEVVTVGLTDKDIEYIDNIIKEVI